MLTDAERIYRQHQPFTVVSFDRWRVIYECLCAMRGQAGDMAELGVYRGGIALMMSEAAPERELHLFDTFTGLPAERKQEVDLHTPGDFSDTSAERVKARFNGHPVRIYPGRFPETVTDDVRGRQFALVHLDADYYRSMLDGIEFFYPRLVKGGALVVDDYRWARTPGVEKAVSEAQARYGFCVESLAPYQAIICKD